MSRHHLLGGLLAAILLAGEARGQSTPNWQTGYVPSAAEWNNLWASKQDTLGFTPLNKAGDTMTGPLVLISGTTGRAPLRVPQGSAPTSPVNGDVWTTSSGMFVRINGVTVGPLSSGGGSVSSVGLTLPTEFSVTGSPVTGTGTLAGAWANENANLVFSGPSTGSPSTPGFRSLVAADLPGDVGYLDVAQSWTKAQRATPATLSISTATFTPSFDAAQNYNITLVHASCPCTVANPSTTPVAGQAGVFQIVQSATGSDTIGTWGSDYVAAGGVSTLTLSTAANAKDVISYYVIDSTHVVLSVGALNVTH